MKTEPRETAVAESYPTFWDQPSKPAVATPIAPEEAYSTFVNLTEDEFPSAVLVPKSQPKATG